MIVPAPAPVSPYVSCLNEAFRQCPLLIRRWCLGVEKALDDHAKVSPESAAKRVLQDAIAALKRHQGALEKNFTAVLTQTIAEDIQPGMGKVPGESPRSFSSLSFDELELMGDSQVQETVESARLQQLVLAACENGLASLSARLATAQGFKVVKSDRNPLRPDVVSRALLGLLQEQPVDNATRTLWLGHGAQALGNELQGLYVLLSERLAAQGVAPAAFGMVAAPSGNPALRRETVPLNEFAATSAGALEPAAEDSLLTLDHLHRLLVGEYDESFKDGGIATTAFGATVPAPLEVLAELQEKGGAAARAQKAPPSLEQMRAQLKLESNTLGQSLAIEVVGLMIEQIAGDTRLLAPVRRVIAEAEPAFLRLGVTDPRFFSDKDHPARLLLEAITAKSLAWASEDASGFAEFMEDLDALASELTEEHASSAQHFAVLLHEFETNTARRESGNSQSQDRAVQALLRAEQRNLLAEKIAEEIMARPDFTGGNRILTGFVTGPWAQVMAKERLLGEHGGLGSQKAIYSLALGELLWSVNLAQAARHRKRLIKMIPEMLGTLREGLLSIDYPLAQSKPFFEELMALHQAALSAPPDLADERSRGLRDLEKAFSDRDRDGANSRTWLAPEEAQNSGFMEDWESAQSKPAFESTLPQPDHDIPTRPEVAEPAHQRAGVDTVTLRLGAWVELLHEDKWQRAQLTWISPYNTLFLFTSEGGRTHSMAGPMLQYLLLQELVKVVNQQGVLEGALDKVARTAMRNSVDRPDRA